MDWPRLLVVVILVGRALGLMAEIGLQSHLALPISQELLAA